MKTISKFFFPLLFLIAISAAGQEVTIRTDKSEYKLNEPIQLTFEITNTVDSVGQTDLSDFEIISGPSHSSSTSIINGEVNSSFQVNYLLKAKRSGNYQIKSPKFYKGNGVFIGNDASISILKTRISEKDIQRQEQPKAPIDLFNKEAGRRYVITGNKGQIEVFNGFMWQFSRQLTPKEIKRLKRIK